MSIIKPSVPISARGRVTFVPAEWLVKGAEADLEVQSAQLAAKRAELTALAEQFVAHAAEVERAWLDRAPAGPGDDPINIAALEPPASVDVAGVTVAADMAEQATALATELDGLEALVAVTTKTLEIYRRGLEIYEGKPPTYYLRVPDYKDKTELTRELGEVGAFNPTNRQMIAALRAHVAEAGDFAEYLALLDSWVEHEDGGQRRPRELVMAVKELEDTIGPKCPEYRRLLAARGHYSATLFGLRCATLIVGYENVLGDDGEPVPYARAHGRMADRCLMAMGADVQLVGSYVQGELARVNGAQEKNSELRSPSPSGRSGSQAA